MPLHFLDIHALQRLCRAGFNTGRSRLPMPAQIALNRPRLFARRNDLHRTKRASQHTAFTANATCLFNENMPMFAAYRVNRADIRARCIFTLMTGYCRGPAVVFNDTNTGNKLVWVTTQRNPDSHDATLRKPLHRYGNRYISSHPQ